jgi:hypothetical protein
VRACPPWVAAACSALYLSTGDASGPNCGALTLAELRALDGTTLEAFVAAAKAARAKFATGKSAYRGVDWQCAPIRRSFFSFAVCDTH